MLKVDGHPLERTNTFYKKRLDNKRKKKYVKKYQDIIKFTENENNEESHNENG